MTLEILREAETELNEAVAHYEAIEPGLGIRLKEEVRKTLLWIRDHPELPRLRPKGYRRVNLKVFRYYIAYHIWANKTWVLALAHSSRRPEYWITRKSNIT
jgi:plasmid stabilization system protein ParE